MVKVPPEKDPLTPAGRLVALAPVPLPPTVKVMLVIAVLIHLVWMFEPGPELSEIVIDC